MDAYEKLENFRHDYRKPNAGLAGAWPINLLAQQLF
jgi:hypothetical protein